MGYSWSSWRCRLRIRGRLIVGASVRQGCNVMRTMEVRRDHWSNHLSEQIKLGVHADCSGANDEEQQHLAVRSQDRRHVSRLRQTRLLSNRWSEAMRCGPPHRLHRY